LKAAGRRPRPLVECIVERLASSERPPLNQLFDWIFLDVSPHGCLAFLDGPSSYAPFSCLCAMSDFGLHAGRYWEAKTPLAMGLLAQFKQSVLQNTSAAVVLGMHFLYSLLFCWIVITSRFLYPFLQSCFLLFLLFFSVLCTCTTSNSSIHYSSFQTSTSQRLLSPCSSLDLPTGYGPTLPLELF